MQAAQSTSRVLCLATSPLSLCLMKLLETGLLLILIEKDLQLTQLGKNVDL